MSKERHETTGREIYERGIQGVEALVEQLGFEHDRITRIIDELTYDLLNPPQDYAKERSVELADQAQTWIIETLIGLEE